MLLLLKTEIPLLSFKGCMHHYSSFRISFILISDYRTMPARIKESKENYRPRLCHI